MRYRSLSWPLFLIATGAVWLLVELHSIPVENLWALAYIWPFFLMAVGVGLILRSRWPLVRSLISALILLGIVLAIVFAPQFGWNKAPGWNFLSFANFNGSISGSGVVVSQSRSLADFNAIEINYPVELTIRQGNSTTAAIQAENNVLPQLATRVSGNTLYIENNQPDWTKRVNPTRPIKIVLTTKDLQRVDFPSAGTLLIDTFQTNRLDLSISGAGSVNLVKLTAQTLSTDLSGAGSITASGTSGSLDTNISGFGSFHAENLACQDAKVNISGAGSATVWAKSSLNADISGTGSVSYFGSPNVTKNVSGLGSVTALGNK